MRAAVKVLRVLLALVAAAYVAPPRASAQAAPEVLTAGDLRVVYWPPQQALAERTLEAARNPFPLPGIPYGAVFPEGTIYLAPSPAVFDSLTGGRAPHWSAGVAIPSLQVIVLPTYSSARTRDGDPAVTLRHELAHLALNAYLPEPIPRWFDEGYATWVSGGFDAGAVWQLRLAFLLGRVPPLDDLALDWPRGADRARFAYLLSASAVSYMAELGGERGFETLLSVWRSEGALEASIRSVYGMTLGQFEREWRNMVRRRYGWLLALSQATIFWTAAALLLVVLFRIRRRRNRERMAQLEAEDRMLPPPDEEGEDAEWYGIDEGSERE